MKKTFWRILLAVTLFSVFGCTQPYDDTEIKGDVSALEARIAALEGQVKELNGTITGIQGILQALQNNDYVTGVSPITKDGEVVGYTIAFSKGNPVSIYNGEKGDKGDKGESGDKGETGDTGLTGPAPSVTIALGEDGRYYWVVEGEVLTDAQGNPIPATTFVPQFKIEEGAWWISTDNGQTWSKLGLVSDTGTTVDVDNSNEEYVILTINGVEVRIPKEKAFTLSIDFADLSSVGVSANSTTGLPYEVQGAAESDEVTVDVLSQTAGISAKITPVDNRTGYIQITTTDVTSGKIFVYADNNKGKTSIKSLTLEEGILESVAEVVQIDPAGGEISLQVNTNVQYDVVVLEGGSSTKVPDWVNVVQTKAAHTDYLTIVADPNTTSSYRYATVTVVNTATGQAEQTYDIIQKPAEGVTSIDSVAGLPGETPVKLDGVVVVAASKHAVILTDGETYISGLLQMEEPVTLKPGDEVSVSGTVLSERYETDLNVTSVTVTGSGKEFVETEWQYLNFTVSTYRSSVAGVLRTATDELNFIETVGGMPVVIDDTEEITVADYTGKDVAIVGYVAYGGEEQYVLIPTEINVIDFKTPEGWAISYDGETSGDQDYPELVTTTVGASETRYTVNIISKESLLSAMEEMGIEAAPEAIDKFAAYSVLDNLQYSITLYSMFGYSVEDVLAALTHVGDSQESYGLFDYDVDYVMIAAGLDENFNPVGEYVVGEFTKPDPHVPGTYEEFLGDYTFRNASGKEHWVLEQDVQGVSYIIKGIGGFGIDEVPDGGILGKAIFDPEKGRVTVSNQALGTWELPQDEVTYNVQDKLVAVWYTSAGAIRSNESYMTDPLIFTIAKLEDGSLDMVVSEDEYGPLEGIAYYFAVVDDPSMGGSYGVSSSFDGASIEKGWQEAPSANYEDFLGKFQVGSSVWTIEEKEQGSTYKVTGVNGLGSTLGGAQEIEAIFTETGQFAIVEQKLDTEEFEVGSYGACDEYLSGIFAYGSSTYAAYPLNSDTPNVILTIAMDASGVYEMTAGSCPYGAFFAMGYSWVIRTGDNAGKGNKESYVTEIPATVEKAPEVSEAYSAWIGEWSIPAVVYQYDDEGSYIGDEESTSIFKVSSSIINKEFKISGVGPANTQYDIVATFDEATGAITVKPHVAYSWQHSTAGQINEQLCGLYMQGEEEYWSTDNTLTIFTATLSEGVATLTPGDAPEGKFTGFQFVQSYSAGNYGYQGYYVLPNTMTKVVSGTSAPAPSVKKVGPQYKAPETMMVSKLGKAKKIYSSCGHKFSTLSSSATRPALGADKSKAIRNNALLEVNFKSIKEERQAAKASFAK